MIDAVEAQRRYVQDVRQRFTKFSNQMAEVQSAAAELHAQVDSQKSLALLQAVNAIVVDAPPDPPSVGVVVQTQPAAPVVTKVNPPTVTIPTPKPNLVTGTVTKV